MEHRMEGMELAEKKIRVLLAKKKIDVHGRGSKLLARELRDAGMEVIYFRFGTVEEIVNAAIQEDVDVIGVSIMTSGHLRVAEKLIPRKSVTSSPPRPSRSIKVFAKSAVISSPAGLTVRSVVKYLSSAVESGCGNVRPKPAKSGSQS